ncbi:MAG TPA: hypothetical protein VH062_00600 [Polyangiaceae bacterium]|jgi:hypothetical protein|nr:hypothetical protein [Polyangiaceae bacterium]
MKPMHALRVASLALAWTSFVCAGTGYEGGDSITPPLDSTSFTTVMAAFPAATTRTVTGYPLASRLLAATGHTMSLQKTFGASDWLPVAKLSSDGPSMDPAFLALTPDAEKIALGCGLSKPLYIFPTSLLSVATPVVLTANANVRRYDRPYYSAAFRDNRYLFLDVGGAELGQSFIEVIDTDAESSNANTVIANIPGASGGITFDASGNLVTGLGWDKDDKRTGEIAIFDATAVDAAVANGTSLDYDATEHVVATNLLSADSLGFDHDGNLFVGGGDVFGSTGHYGYAQVVSASVVARVLTGGAPADPDDANDVTKLSPDPCHNDDWTGITFVPGVDTVIVSANLGTTPPNCATVDWTTGPVTPATIYFPPDAPDTDHDGIPDGADPDYEQQRFLGRDELSRLTNALDATKAEPNFDASVDYDASGKIDDADFAFLRAHWGTPVPDGTVTP